MQAKLSSWLGKVCDSNPGSNAQKGNKEVGPKMKSIEKVDLVKFADLNAVLIGPAVQVSAHVGRGGPPPPQKVASTPLHVLGATSSVGPLPNSSASPGTSARVASSVDVGCLPESLETDGGGGKELASSGEVASLTDCTPAPTCDTKEVAEVAGSVDVSQAPVEDAIAGGGR